MGWDSEKDCLRLGSPEADWKTRMYEGSGPQKRRQVMCKFRGCPRACVTAQQGNSEEILTSLWGKGVRLLGSHTCQSLARFALGWWKLSANAWKTASSPREVLQRRVADANLWKQKWTLGGRGVWRLSNGTKRICVEQGRFPLQVGKTPSGTT